MAIAFSYTMTMSPAYLSILYIFFQQFYRVAKFSNFSVEKFQEFRINWLTKTQFETLKQHNNLIRINMHGIILATAR